MSAEEELLTVVHESFTSEDAHVAVGNVYEVMLANIVVHDRARIRQHTLRRLVEADNHPGFSQEEESRRCVTMVCTMSQPGLPRSRASW